MFLHTQTHTGILEQLRLLEVFRPYQLSAQPLDVLKDVYIWLFISPTSRIQPVCSLFVFVESVVCLHRRGEQYSTDGTFVLAWNNVEYLQFLFNLVLYQMVALTLTFSS